MTETLGCSVPVAPIRREPHGDAEQVTQALFGEPLVVEERLGGWARVRTAYDYPGWIEESDLGGEPMPDWLPAATGGDPVAEARAFLGTTYLWGGLSTQGIDCSGLVHMAYRRLGVLVPRDAHEQEAAGAHVTDPHRGDLATYGAETATHIAFWLGDGRILHATGSSGAEAVVEEEEPVELRALRRGFVRIER
jgi:gamma-D-glutamyl-L-lysine dipeptidyl-peptidase